MKASTSALVFLAAVRCVTGLISPWPADPNTGKNFQDWRLTLFNGPLTTHLNMISAPDCYGWIQATTNDDCFSLAKLAGVKVSLFNIWNPSLYADCYNVTVGNAYCADSDETSLPGVTTTSILTPTSTAGAIVTPLPTQPGMVSNCVWFHPLQHAEFCEDVVQEFSEKIPGLTVADLIFWNPAVGPDCLLVQAGYYMCVETADFGPNYTTSSSNYPTTTTTSSISRTSSSNHPTTTTLSSTSTITSSNPLTTTSTLPTSTTSTKTPGPSPVQSGQPSNCIGLSPPAISLDALWLIHVCWGFIVLYVI